MVVYNGLRQRYIRKLLLMLFSFVLLIWISYTTLIAIAGTLETDPTIADAHNVSHVLSVPIVTDYRKLQQLRKLVGNRNQRALEKIKMLSTTKSFRYIIVVQVHDRITYIKALMDSFAATKNMEDALVVFSHDVIDAGIDVLVTGADLNYEVVQIYFPFSIQLYPSEFPGLSSMDCPDRVGKSEATKRRCINHDHPDTYGNYRTPSLTQVKHHWWWKYQFVFTVMPQAADNTPVIFVEEDHYFLPDALTILDQLNELRKSACGAQHCPMVSIAHHKVKLAETTDSYKKYAVAQWVGSRDNIGLVIDMEQYRAINGCADTFCAVDDYNWDWSLYFVLKSCLKKDYPMLVPVAPRVLHIGDCGGIHHKAACNPQQSVRKAAEVVAAAKDKLFPDKLTATSTKFPKHKDSKVNGGWGDPRDINLCRNFTRSFVDL